MFQKLVLDTTLYIFFRGESNDGGRESMTSGNGRKRRSMVKNPKFVPPGMLFCITAGVTLVHSSKSNGGPRRPLRPLEVAGNAVQRSKTTTLDRQVPIKAQVHVFTSPFQLSFHVRGRPSPIFQVSILEGKVKGQRSGKDWRSGKKVFSFSVSRVFSHLLFHGRANGEGLVALRRGERVPPRRRRPRNDPRVRFRLPGSKT